MVKHFLKTLSIFMIMIILGLLGVFLVNHFDEAGKVTNATNDETEVAK
jgi:hypothetical protein